MSIKLGGDQIIRRAGGRVLRCYNSLRFPYTRKERKHKFIFLHIPKTGGTSIRGALGYPTTGRSHLPWYVYYSADSVFFDKAFKFAMVRNPWDRVVSAYHYLAQGGNNANNLSLAREIRKYDDFTDFVKSGLSRGAFRSNLLFLPQSNFLIDGDRGLRVDFVGKLENFSEDFERIAQRLPFNILPVSNLNRSSRPHDYMQYFEDEEVVAAVTEIYRQDIEIFQYSFDGRGK